jgi:choline dehydrogenase-like flavoprotein
VSDRFPNGLGNDSGELGHNLMDHHQLVGASGAIDGFQDKYYKGRKPNGIYIPRFRNLNTKTQSKNFLRGYGYQGGAGREGWWRVISELGIGDEMKEEAMQPGQWRMGLTGFGEMLPDHANRAWMNHERTDIHGLPTLTIDCGFGENELAMRKDMKSSAGEILEACGFRDIDVYEHRTAPGRSIHEMGTARMGRDPRTSILNAHNQIHAVPNVFVTDGACMASTACQNPSLTYMALTARAADFAVNEMRLGNL